MKNSTILLFVWIFIAVNTTSSQVAINMTGNNPHPSAMLDINATDKGLLIPRVSLTTLEDNQAPVANPATGLMVFNTEGNAQASGLYVWTGYSWTSYTTMEQVINTLGASTPAPSFGEMYEYHSSGSYTPVTIPEAGTWVQWPSAIAGNMSNMNFSSSSFIITQEGSYRVSFNTAAQLNKAGYVVDAAVFVNGALQDNLTMRMWFKEHNKPYMITLSGILYLAANDTVSIQFTMNDDGIMRIETANFSLNKID